MFAASGGVWRRPGVQVVMCHVSSCPSVWFCSLFTVRGVSGLCVARRAGGSVTCVLFYGVSALVFSSRSLVMPRPCVFSGVPAPAAFIRGFVLACGRLASICFYFFLFFPLSHS